MPSLPYVPIGTLVGLLPAGTPFYLPGPPIGEAALIDLTKGAGGLLSELFGSGLHEIRFPYMPESFSESKSAEYAQVPVLGRSEPLLGYRGSGPRIFNLNLTFVAHAEPFLEVIKPIWLIRSWVYPDYSDDLPNVPPRVLFVVGKWLSQRCVVLRVDITYHAPWGRLPWSTQITTPGGLTDPFSLLKDSVLPYWAEVSLTLQETAENTDYTPWDHNQVYEGEDRGSGFFNTENGPVA